MSVCRTPENRRLDVFEALYQRKSIRAFLPDPVPRASVERILAAAAHAPSGTNTQPWHVRVLTGAARQRLVDAVLAFRTANPGVEHWAYSYYPKKWQEPFLGRRRKVGWDLYGLLGITRTESERIRDQHNRNFSFFDAPVGLMFTIERELELGSWLDYGMFIQSLALAAEAQLHEDQLDVLTVAAIPLPSYSVIWALARSRGGVGGGRGRGRSCRVF